MIRIFVKGQELALRRDTVMTVELNNALFASPDIEGDISFSFTLPVDGNELLLDFAHLPQADTAKMFPCTVYCNGGFNWNGQMLVQKSSHDTIIAALIINPYPDDFGNRSLAENHDDDIVISSTRETHNTQWKLFLSDSVNNTDVKFAPFFNEEGYGSDNEDFGCWNGHGRPKIVNALWFDTQGQMIDSAGRPFSKAHNAVFDVSEETGTDEEGNTVESTHRETNQLAFCPQIRIAKILDIWCRNAGYKFINHIGEDYADTFLQSQKSLDGTTAQYEQDITTVFAHAEISEANTSYWLESSDTEHVHGGCLYLYQTGWWTLDVKARFRFQGAPGNIRFIIYENGKTPSQAAEGEGVVAECPVTPSQESYGLYSVKAACKLMITAESAGIALRMAFFKGNNIMIEGYSEHYHGEIPSGLDITVTGTGMDSAQTGFNIFRRRFNIPELLPEVTNSTFLKTMTEAMGLCYFISGKTKTIEMVPYAVLKSSKNLDLTEYELTRETEASTPEEKLRTFRLKPMKDEEYNEDLRLEDVEIHLPDAYNSHEHLVLRTKTNTLYRAEKQETETEESWVEGWREYGGNPDRLETGHGDEENREPSVRIPHQRLFSTGRRNPDIDIQSGETPQLMVADFTISSDLYNTSEKPSDIILTQYRGFREREYQTSSAHRLVKNEVMLPVWGKAFALKAKGANSLGEKYIRPVLELLGHRTVTYKLRLPAGKMQAVEDLLRPSELEPERQTRFLIVRNVKSVPKKITFQIDNTIDNTVLCKIEAVKVY